MYIVPLGAGAGAELEMSLRKGRESLIHVMWRRLMTSSHSLYDSAYQLKNESYGPNVDQDSDQDQGSARSSDHVEEGKIL